MRKWSVNYHISTCLTIKSECSVQGAQMPSFGFIPRLFDEKMSTDSSVTTAVIQIQKDLCWVRTDYVHIYSNEQTIFHE